MKYFFKALSSTAATIMIIAAIVFFMSIGDTITALKPAKSFEDIWDEMPSKGDHIKGTPLEIWGIFATQDTVTKNKSGKTVSTQKGTATFYVVPMGFDDELLGVLGVKVGKAFTSDWDRLYKDLIAYYNYETDDYPEPDFIFEGKVKEMKDASMIRYFKKWMKDDEYTEEEINNMPLYLIESINPKFSFAMTFGGIVVFIGCIVFTILQINKVKEAEEQARREAERIIELQRQNEMMAGEAAAGMENRTDTFNTENNTAPAENMSDTTPEDTTIQ